MGIKHILYEHGVEEIFRLEVVGGDYAGTYEIERPDGWDDVDSKIDIDDELFFVKNFIIGDSEKIRFMENYHFKAYDIIKKVYKEQNVDGQVKFLWIAEKDGVEYNLLKDNFEINFSKYSQSWEKSMQKIEIELMKSEARNKLFNREEITVNLFAEKDLDENDIEPVETFDIGYKKGDKVLSNFYTYDISQSVLGNLARRYKNTFFSFVRSDEYGIGDNTNKYASWDNIPAPLLRVYQGPFISTTTTLPNLKVEISNFDVYIAKGSSTPGMATLKAVFRVGENVVRTINLQSTTNEGQIKIDNKIFNLNEIDENGGGNLRPGENLTFEIITDEDVDIGFSVLNTNTSIEISSNLESPLVRSKGVRLIDGLKQLVKNYTSSELQVISNFIGGGGVYYNTSISTGIYLRGLPAKYLNQKINTSFKSLMLDGAAKLLGLGYDVLDENVIVEDFPYFFKDSKFYNLSEKQYLTEGYKIENDKDVVYNQLLFGSKKYSTDVKDDIKNFTTESESSTPIKSVKSKFDKQTSLIVDEFKIQELIEDKSTSTNNDDDDLVVIDMVGVENYSDTGVFENTIHSADGGFLWLNCTATPFDTTLMEVGTSIEILEGLNTGNWQIVEIELSKMKLSGTTTIQSGVSDSPIKYLIPELVKNRTNDGFTEDKFIRNFETATNIRHNPKYQMARWFAWFGSGLRKKQNSELIKTTKYKNNSDAQVKAVSADLANELPGLITVGADETLGRLRSYAQTLFSGDIIEISYYQISFEEFLMIYEMWRYGAGNNRLLSRGYISLNTPEGIYDVYPFGDGAFSHNKRTNVLSIKGKIKGKSVDNPTLLNVNQIDKNTVAFTWDFAPEFVNPITKIQYSFDGVIWQTLTEVDDVKTETVQSSVFDEIMTGETVYFRVSVSSADYYNKISNTLPLTWQFNDWVVKELTRTENTNCGYSYLNLQFKGTADLDIEWEFTSTPGGGKAKAVDLWTNTTQVEFTSTDGTIDYNETQNTSFSFTGETKEISIQLQNATKNESLKPLNCNSGNENVYVDASLAIKITDGNIERNFLLLCSTEKYWFNRPNPTPVDPV